MFNGKWVRERFVRGKTDFTHFFIQSWYHSFILIVRIFSKLLRKAILFNFKMFALACNQSIFFKRYLYGALSLIQPVESLINSLFFELILSLEKPH